MEVSFYAWSAGKAMIIKVNTNNTEGSKFRRELSPEEQREMLEMRVRICKTQYVFENSHSSFLLRAKHFCCCLYKPVS